MAKIGRNDPCPCMSGQKYKNCCGKTGIWEYFNNQGLLYFDERYYLESLLKNEHRFLNLYRMDRNKVNKPILFFKSNINLKARMSYGNIGNDAYLIISKYNKIPIEESVHAAHELEHLVLHSSGHKVVFYINESFNQTLRKHKMLNDMIYNPLANKRLLEFGYDMVSYLKLSDSIQMNLPKIGENPFLVMTLYVKRILDFRNINPGIDKNQIDYIKWVQKDYPEVVEDSEKILKIIEEIGISTLRETEESLKHIINYLSLDDKLILKNL
jgi:hypothetical protein